MKVSKKISDEKMEHYVNKFVTRDMIDTIIDKDAEVYNEHGELLLLFRKKKLTGGQDFYGEVADFMKQNPSSNRSVASGQSHYDLNKNPKINTTILGYFDIWGPSQKSRFKKRGIKMPLEVRETMFVAKHPDKFKRMIPYIKQIDVLYKKYLPDYYKKQCRKAKETPFKVGNTAFTTITTNINFQTAIHKDRGDDEEGFGNLAVIERGKYTGGETCFPQYGIGVNVREGDVLFMNVHEWHGNLPIKFEQDAERMSVVCYLRKRVWERTRNKTRSFMERHNKTMRAVFA